MWKKLASASAVAFPVSSYAQIVKAKADISVPSRDTAWPIQTTVNANIPLGRLYSIVMISDYPSEHR
jgi:hypothetical protein